MPAAIPRGIAWHLRTSVARTACQADLAGRLKDDRYQDRTNGGLMFPFRATTKNGQVTALEEVYLA
jgi:hypothetical protein